MDSLIKQQADPITSVVQCLNKDGSLDPIKYCLFLAQQNQQQEEEDEIEFDAILE